MPPAPQLAPPQPGGPGLRRRRSGGQCAAGAWRNARSTVFFTNTVTGSALACRPCASIAANGRRCAASLPGRPPGTAPARPARPGASPPGRRGAALQRPADPGAGPGAALVSAQRPRAAGANAWPITPPVPPCRHRPGVYPAPATRWGSLSAQGVVSLNWRLLKAHPEQIDYVICHELAHFRQRNTRPRSGAKWKPCSRIGKKSAANCGKMAAFISSSETICRSHSHGNARLGATGH